MRTHSPHATRPSTLTALAAGATAVTLALAVPACAQDTGSLGSSGSTSGLGSTSTPPPGSVRYVALGDSFAAAPGVPVTQLGSPAACGRSSADYPSLLAAARPELRLVDVTCSGADTADLAAAQEPGIGPQLDAVTADTGLVTVSIGGNDSSVYSRLVGGCAQIARQTGDYAGAPCTAASGDSFERIVRTTTGPAVSAALAAIRAKAPAARVLVVGYPRILPETMTTACQPSMPVALGDAALLDGVERELNEVIAAATAAAPGQGTQPVTYVDTYAPSAGHDACQAPGTRWIEPIVGNTGAAPVHPNALGTRGMADAALAVLR